MEKQLLEGSRVVLLDISKFYKMLPSHCIMCSLYNGNIESVHGKVSLLSNITFFFKKKSQLGRNLTIYFRAFRKEQQRTLSLESGSHGSSRLQRNRVVRRDLGLFLLVYLFIIYWEWQVHAPQWRLEGSLEESVPSFTM